MVDHNPLYYNLIRTGSLADSFSVNLFLNSKITLPNNFAFVPLGRKMSSFHKRERQARSFDNHHCPSANTGFSLPRSDLSDIKLIFLLLVPRAICKSF